MNGIVLDESRLPILVVRWCGNPTREDFEAYLARMTDFITARELRARVTLHDASDAMRSQATFRREQADWMTLEEGLVWADGLLRAAGLAREQAPGRLR